MIFISIAVLLFCSLDESQGLSCCFGMCSPVTSKYGMNLYSSHNLLTQLRFMFPMMIPAPWLIVSLIHLSLCSGHPRRGGRLVKTYHFWYYKTDLWCSPSKSWTRLVWLIIGLLMVCSFINWCTLQFWCREIPWGCPHPWRAYRKYSRIICTLAGVFFFWVIY